MVYVYKTVKFQKVNLSITQQKAIKRPTGKIIEAAVS